MAVVGAIVVAWRGAAAAAVQIKYSYMHKKGWVVA
jgi:hypothetical protein